MIRLTKCSGKHLAIYWLAFTFTLIFATSAVAEVVSFENIETVPAFDGRAFGPVGSYELITARVRGEIDPTDPLNAIIADIELAPKNADGSVEYSTLVTVLRPTNMARANNRLFFEVLNRGNKGIVSRFNNGPGGNDLTSGPERAGDGFLFERGYTLAWAGWQSSYNVAEGSGRMIADIPIAVHADGERITEQILFEAIFNDLDSSEISLVFPTASLEAPDARILVRNSSTGERVEVPRSTWAFSDERTVTIDRTGPFFAAYDAGAAYELIYTAIDPDVAGLGYAITRDVVSFLRYDDTEANPLRGAINYALAHGNSQSGRMLKGFIYDGFNEDLSGKIVFDAININISGAHGMDLNRRFGDANATGRAYERHTSTKIEFPFTYATLSDPLTGIEDGIFRVCRENDTCPRVFHTDSANEAWGKAAMLVTTDGLGQDIDLPDDIRYYYFAGTQHGPAATPSLGICQQLSNPNRWQPYLRALFVAMDAWATAGVTPPASNYPRVSDGTLAPNLPQQLLGWPKIPGVSYNGTINTVGLIDKSTPPYKRIEGQDYVVLAPRVDADGNELAGIRSVDIAVPHATYTGWALRAAGFAEGEECTLQGQYIPFTLTKEERLAVGDPRLSIEERYGSHGEYVRLVAAAAAELVSNGYLLQEDADAIIEAAAVNGLPVAQ